MNQINIAQGTGEGYSLHGGAYRMVGVGGALLLPGSGPGAAVEARLDLDLAGTPEQIEAGLRLLDRLLEDAAAAAPAAWTGGLDSPAGGSAEAGTGRPYYLEVQVVPGGPLYRSRILRGWLELPQGAATRAAGTGTACLRLVRANAWENASAAPVELLGSAGAAVCNHVDDHSGHTNRAGVMSGEVAASTPLRVAYTLTTPVTAPATVYIGQLRQRRSGVNPFLRGAAGAARGGALVTAVSDAGSSGGSYASIAFHAPGGWTLARQWGYNLSGPAVDALDGKAYRALLRIPGGPAERFTAALDISCTDPGGVERTLWASDPFTIEVGRELAEGPLLFLPPWPAAGGASGAPALRINLSLGAEAAGSRTFPLDYLGLLPLDGWRIYRPLLGTPGADLVDDARTGPVRSPGGVVTHTAEGPGFTLAAAEDSLFTVYASLESTAPIALEGRLQVGYVESRRTV